MQGASSEEVPRMVDVMYASIRIEGYVQAGKAKTFLPNLTSHN